MPFVLLSDLIPPMHLHPRLPLLLVALASALWLGAVVPYTTISSYQDADSTFSAGYNPIPLDCADADRVVVQARAKSKAGWGIGWSVGDSHHYSATIAYDDSRYDGIYDPAMTLTVSEQTDSTVRTILTASAEGVNPQTRGYNSMRLTILPADGSVKVEVGEKNFETVASFTVALDTLSSVGLSCEAPLHLFQVMATTERRLDASLPSGWDVETLTARFRDSSDPLEGFWEYLDRDVDDCLARAGGRYLLALVSDNAGGYDIIYVGGADTNSSEWHPGFRRGHLSPTIFTDNYTLEWTDAMFRTISQDAYATIDQSAILTLRFPTYKSQLRFSRRPLSPL